MTLVGTTLRRPFILIKDYFKRITTICQWRFVVFLVVSQMLVKGLLYRLAQTTMLPIFKDMGVDAGDLQVFSTIAMSPWSIKPVIGVLSDLFTVRGYHKRYWLVQAICAGIGSASLTFFVDQWPFVLVLCFMGLNYEMSIVDLLTEGKYAEKMQEHPESGSDLITFVNGLQALGSIIAMSFIGHVSDLKLFWILFIVATVMAAVPLGPAVLGWLPEQRFSKSFVEIDWVLFRKNRAIFAVVAFTGLAGPVVAFLATYASRAVGLTCAVLLLVGAVTGSYMAFTPVIAQIGLYQVLTRLTKPSMGTALDYFFTSPQGPNFSFKYYITYTGIASACVGFATVWLYQAFLSKWRFRSVLIFTTCLVGVGGLSDLLIVLRVNLKMGISDHAFYFFGEAVFESACEMLYWIPSSVIIAKVCPPGLESATYAFLAGISNFALMVAELSGAMIFEAAGVGKDNFDALWWLVLTFHIALPILGGVPITWLIPDLTQDAAILREEPSDLYLVVDSSDVEMGDF